MHDGEERYAGFWLRSWAALLDSLCLLALLLPAALLIYGFSYFSPGDGWFRGPVDFFLQIVLPFLLVFWFWHKWLATPGKMLLASQILDARTGGAPSSTQLLVRYLGYFVSLFPLGLGFLWIALDRRKQGWHDKLARTVVVVSPESQESGRRHRTLVLLTGVSLAVLLATGLAGAIWLWRNYSEIADGWRHAESAQQEGVLWGIGIPAQRCLPEALKRLDACRGFFCGYQSSFFLGGCLPAAEKPSDFCRDIPRDLGPLAAVGWQRERCRQLGRTTWGCLQVLSVAVLFCEQHTELAAAPQDASGFVR